jgi:hypothetical protein
LSLTLLPSAPGPCHHPSSALPYCRCHSLLSSAPLSAAATPLSPILHGTPNACRCLMPVLPYCRRHFLQGSTPVCLPGSGPLLLPAFHVLSPCAVPDASRRLSTAQPSCCCHSLLGSAPAGRLGRSHPSFPQIFEWAPRYLLPSTTRIQISGNFYPKLPCALLCTNTNGVDQNPEGLAGDKDCAQNNDGGQTPHVKCKVPDVGNPDNADCCDAQGL